CLKIKKTAFPAKAGIQLPAFSVNEEWVPAFAGNAVGVDVQRGGRALAAGGGAVVAGGVAAPGGGAAEAVGRAARASATAFSWLATRSPGTETVLVAPECAAKLTANPRGLPRINASGRPAPNSSA